MTRALLRLGTAPDPPDAYDRAHIAGEHLTIEYDRDWDRSEKKAVKRFFPGDVTFDLSKLPWEAMGASAPDPACLLPAWAALGSRGPQVDVPVIATRPDKVAQVIDVHTKQAARSPPLSLQLQGLGFGLVCGKGDRVARAVVPPPDTDDHGRSPGAVVAIVLLFPSRWSPTSSGEPSCTSGGNEAAA